MDNNRSKNGKDSGNFSMVACSRPCKNQKNGYCEASPHSVVTNVLNENCLFFQGVHSDVPLKDGVKFLD